MIDRLKRKTFWPGDSKEVSRRKIKYFEDIVKVCYCFFYFDLTKEKYFAFRSTRSAICA